MGRADSVEVIREKLRIAETEIARARECPADAWSHVHSKTLELLRTREDEIMRIKRRVRDLSARLHARSRKEGIGT